MFLIVLWIFWTEKWMYWFYIIYNYVFFFHFLCLWFSTSVPCSTGKWISLVHSVGQHLKFLVVNKSTGKNKINIYKNGYFYAKWVFDKIDFGFWCNSKTNGKDTWNFCWMFIIVFRILDKNFQNILSCLRTLSAVSNF